MFGVRRHALGSNYDRPLQTLSSSCYIHRSRSLMNFDFDLTSRTSPLTASFRSIKHLSARLRSPTTEAHKAQLHSPCSDCYHVAITLTHSRRSAFPTSLAMPGNSPPSFRSTCPKPPIVRLRSSISVTLVSRLRSRDPQAPQTRLRSNASDTTMTRLHSSVSMISQTTISLTPFRRSPAPATFTYFAHLGLRLRYPSSINPTVRLRSGVSNLTHPDYAHFTQILGRFA